MSHGPFDMGRGRNGPRASGIPTLGQGRVQQAAPYRIDMSDEEFTAVGDVAVCTLAPPREKSMGGIELPTQASPFHIVLSIGPKVNEVAGVELEVGDVIAMEGAPFADTLAGRVWFVRADKILAVVTRRQETEPAPPFEEDGIDADTLPPTEAVLEEAPASPETTEPSVAEMRPAEAKDVWEMVMEQRELARQSEARDEETKNDSPPVDPPPDPEPVPA